MIRLHAHPLPPISGQQVVSISHCSCVSQVEHILTDGTGGGGGGRGAKSHNTENSWPFINHSIISAVYLLYKNMFQKEDKPDWQGMSMDRANNLFKTIESHSSNEKKKHTRPGTNWWDRAEHLPRDISNWGLNVRKRPMCNCAWRTACDGIFKLSRSPGINSKESIPPAFVAWRAGTTTLFLLGS
jgi:hypothetical protein